MGKKRRRQKRVASLGGAEMLLIFAAAGESANTRAATKPVRQSVALYWPFTP